MKFERDQEWWLDRARQEPDATIGAGTEMAGEIDMEKLISEGWQYRDIPWCSAEMWAKLMSIIGENMIPLAMTERSNGDRRGQLLISPAGMQRLKDYVAAEKKAK